MKKLFIAVAFILILCLSFVSCDNETNSSYSDSSANVSSDISSNTDTSSNTETNDSGNTVDSTVDNSDESSGESTESSIVDNVTVDTSIKVDYDADREAKDSEFPFDSIIIERDGYDLVAAGKYYGHDFDSVKYYGSYYRIIDNYEDFSELTTRGNQIDKSVFEENIVLALHTYKRNEIYYSHTKYSKMNVKGTFKNFGIDTDANKLCIYETWVIDGGAFVGGDSVPDMEDCKIIIPIEKRETTYLLIPKGEIPDNLPINGEIVFLMKLITLL